MSRSLLLILLALTPALSLAQRGLVSDTLANDSLRAFEARMTAQPICEQAAAPLTEYVLVWTEHDNGYSRTITPGNTATTLDTMMVPDQISLDFMVDGPIYYGERYALLVRERPVSMLDVTRWYFERH